jgi:hypothetical protein
LNLIAEDTESNSTPTKTGSYVDEVPSSSIYTGAAAGAMPGPAGGGEKLNTDSPVVAPDTPDSSQTPLFPRTDQRQLGWFNLIEVQNKGIGLQVSVYQGNKS